MKQIPKKEEKWKKENLSLEKKLDLILKVEALN